MPHVVDCPRRFRIRTIGGLLTELTRIYRLGHQGKMVWSDVAAASRVLREIRLILEADGFEQRIIALEQAVADQPKPNGGGGRHWSARP